MRMARIVVASVAVGLFSGCAAQWKPRVERMAEPRRSGVATAGAVASNLLYVPGRAVVCGGSALLAFSVMAVTVGQDYDGAAELMHGGCSGPWIVKPDDVR